MADDWLAYRKVTKVWHDVNFDDSFRPGCIKACQVGCQLTLCQL